MNCKGVSIRYVVIREKPRAEKETYARPYTPEQDKISMVVCSFLWEIWRRRTGSNRPYGRVKDCERVARTLTAAAQPPGRAGLKLARMLVMNGTSELVEANMT